MSFPGVVRSLTFTTFLMANMGLIFTNRSWSRTIPQSSLRDRTLWVVTLGALAFMALVLYAPILAHLFRFSPLSPVDLLVALAAGALSITWFELLKMSGRIPAVESVGVD